MDLARELLGGITSARTLCQGNACGGEGEVYTISDEELQKRRQMLLEAYPDAAVLDWEPVKQARFPSWNRNKLLLVNADTGEDVWRDTLLL